MKKLILIFLLMIFVLAVSVSATGVVDVKTAVPSTGAVSFGSSLSLVSVPVAITVGNSGADSIPLVNLIVEKVSGPAFNIATQTSSVSNVVNTSDQTAQVTLTFNRNALPGVYGFRVTGTESGNDINTDGVSFTITVPSAPAFEILKGSSSLSQIDMNGEQGETSTLTLSIKNSGNTQLTNLHIDPRFTVASLEDNDRDTITLQVSPNVVNTLDIGATVQFSVTADVESGFDTKKIDGSLEVSVDGGLSGSLPFKLNVAPLMCNSQSSDSGLNVDIDSPDDGDDYTTNQKVQLNLNVENKKSDDMRVRVVGLLYDLDRERDIETSTLTERVRDGDDKDFVMDLEFNDDVDEDSDVVLYIKVFEVGNEEETCFSDALDLNVEVPEHSLVFDSVSVGPTTVTCSDRVTGSLVLRNVGSNDENAAFYIKNTDLGINQVLRDIRISEDREENTKPVTFNFVVPENARAGDYDLELKATYNGEQTTQNSRFTVTECNRNTNVNAGTTSGVQTTGTNGVNPLNNAFVTGSVVDKSFWDNLSSGSFKVPFSVWVLVDVLLFVLIIVSLVFLFRRR